MYVEYCNYNKYIEDYSKELQYVFKAIDNNINGLALPLHMINEIKEFIPKDIALVTAIDYPLGYSTSKTRIHAIISAAKAGVNIIDFVPNQYLLRNKFVDLKTEIKTALSICEEYGCNLRIFLDYHFSSDPVAMAKIYKKTGVDTFYPTIGYHYDDFYDNLITTKLLEKNAEVNIIFNGYISNKDQFEMICNSGVFGIRLYQLNFWCK